MKIAHALQYTVEARQIDLERLVLIISSSEKSVLWNLPPSDIRQHFLLHAATGVSSSPANLLQSTLSAELLAEQRIDDYYYDTKDFALFTKGYVCCLRQMLSRSALCLMPVTANAEQDSSRSSLVAQMSDGKARKQLKISCLQAGEIKSLLGLIITAKKLRKQFRVRTDRQHFQVTKSSHKIPLILDTIWIKPSRSSSLVISSRCYNELILTRKPAERDLISSIHSKLKNRLSLYPLKINAFRRAIEMDSKMLQTVRHSMLAVTSSERSGHDLFRAHMRAQFSELQFWEALAIEGSDAEGVHRMRVSIRRIRAALKTFAPVLSKTDTQHWHTEFRWLAKRLAEVRDLDVFTQWLEEHKSMADTQVNKYIDVYQNDIGELYHHVRQGLFANLTSDRYCIIKQEFSAWIEQEQCFFVNNDLTWKPTQKLADALLKRQLRRINRRVKLIDDQCPADRLHRFRVECKRVRYSLDMLDDYSSKNHKPLIVKLKQIQEVLGDHQDACERAKRIRLYVDGRSAGKHGQAFVFFLGRLFSEQQLIIKKASKVYFTLQGSAEKTLAHFLKS